MRRKVIIDQDTLGPATTNLQSIALLVQSPDVEVEKTRRPQHVEHAIEETEFDTDLHAARVEDEQAFARDDHRARAGALRIRKG